MDSLRSRQHRLNNALQSLLLIATMFALTGLLGWVVAGGFGLLLALTACVIVLAFGPHMSPGLVLRMYRARELGPNHAPMLHQIVHQLSRRAELPRAPRLYYIPSTMLNAFAVGSRDNAAVAVTDGLLRKLNPRELSGVLAHEISHVRHNDMWVMNLADVLSRLTTALSQAGIILALITLPLALFGVMSVSLLTLLLLIAAPSLAALLQLGLSRTREYDADIGAAELTGDPQGLASALAKLEHHQGGWMERILLPGRHEPNPALLRTHPHTRERIQRLTSLLKRPLPVAGFHPPETATPQRLFEHPPVPLRRRPGWHLNGLWY